MIALPTGVYTLGQAMARQEGFFTGAGRAFRNNNPGNIAWLGTKCFAAKFGATRGDVGPNTPMAVFPTLAAGMAAHQALLLTPSVIVDGKLEKGYCGATLEQIIYRYCPPDAPGNMPELTEIYVRNCETWMHCQRTDIVTEAMIRGVS